MSRIKSRIKIRNGRSLAIVEPLLPSDPDWKYRSGNRWVVTYVRDGGVYGGGLADMWEIVATLAEMEAAA